MLTDKELAEGRLDLLRQAEDTIDELRKELATMKGIAAGFQVDAKDVGRPGERHMNSRLTLTGDPAGECQWAEAKRGVILFGRTVRTSSTRDPLQDRLFATFSVTDLEMMLDMARASRRVEEGSLAAAVEWHKAQVAVIEARRLETRRAE